MEKFRLAVFNTQPPQLYFGGVERRIIETTKRLHNQADITIYSGTKAGFKKPSQFNGVTLVPCHSTDWLYPLDNWSFNRSISKKVNSIDADIYEAHAVSGYRLSRALKNQAVSKPFVHVVHGVLADEYEQARMAGYPSFRGRVANYFMRRLAKLEEETAQNAMRVVTISNYSFGKIRQLYDVDASKLRIVPNGVDIEKFKPAADLLAAKQRLGLSKEPSVLFVGSLIPRKGLIFLVEAAKKIVKEHAETKFLIVGEGPLKNKLLHAIEAAEVSANFKFLGNLKEDALATAYSCTDVFVLPSIQEGQGIVLLEAEASGEPVVAFDVGGVNEAMRHGETGLLVKRGDSDEFAAAITRLLSDRGLREKMGLNARKFVSESFTWDICAQKMLQVYREVLGT